MFNNTRIKKNQNKRTKELQYLITFKILLQDRKKMKTTCRLKENVNSPSQSLMQYRSIQTVTLNNAYITALINNKNILLPQ